MINGWFISCESAHKWMSPDFTDVKSTLVQVIITWANVDPDLCRHMVSLGHNVLRQHTVTIHVTGLMGLAYSPAACINDQFTMTVKHEVVIPAARALPIGSKQKWWFHNVHLLPRIKTSEITHIVICVCFMNYVVLLVSLEWQACKYIDEGWIIYIYIIPKNV